MKTKPFKKNKNMKAITTIALVSFLLAVCMATAPAMAGETGWNDTFSDETGIATMYDLTIANENVNMGYFGDWSYRRPITISNTAGDLIDYQVKIVYDFSAEYYTKGKKDPKIQQYCDDVRFTY